MIDRIIKKNIPENINDYKYFIYLWTIVETGKQYCGYHLGVPLRDGYYHSSEDETFNKEFSNSEFTMKYEVLGYFKYEKEAKRFEGLSIRTKKQQGVNMANISLSSKPFWDKNKVYKVYNDIESGTLKYKLKPKSEISKLGWWQTRSEGSRKHKVDIRKRIDDKGGSLELTDALIVVNGTNKELGLGDEVGISGKHTGEAIQDSKHATEYKRIDIDCSDWNKAEIKKLSSLLNDDEELKLRQTTSDYVKEIVELWVDSKIEPDSTEAYDWLEGYKSLSISDRSTIMERAKVIVDTKKDELTSGREKKQYHHNDSDTIKIMSNYEEVGVKILLMGSGRHNYNRIFETMWNVKEKDWLEGIHTIRVLIHHSSKKNKKNWTINGRPELELMEEKLELPFEIEYIELPYYKSDKRGTK